MIAAILLERNLQNVANYLIVSLAVADLMVACLVMPLGAVYVVSTTATPPYRSLFENWDFSTRLGVGNVGLVVFRKHSTTSSALPSLNRPSAARMRESAVAFVAPIVNYAYN